MTTGRNVPKPAETLTLSSGITVGIRKVSPHTMAAIGKAIKKPTPPLATVDYGDGKTRQEPNENDPAYQQTLADWQQAITEKAQEVIYDLGVVVDIDHAALQALREKFKHHGLPIHPDDQIAYVRHIVVSCEEDATAIAEATTSKSQPTEEAVQDHLDTFPDPVQESPVPAMAIENGGAELPSAAGVGTDAPVARDSTL